MSLNRVVALSDYRGTPRLGSVVAFFSDKQHLANIRRASPQATETVVQDLDWDLPLDQLSRKRWRLSEMLGAGKLATGNTFTAIRPFVYLCLGERVLVAVNHTGFPKGTPHSPINPGGGSLTVLDCGEMPGGFGSHAFRVYSELAVGR